MYDDSADTWTETEVGSGLTDELNHPAFDAAVRHSDGGILLAVHSNEDSVGDDFLTFEVIPNPDGKANCILGWTVPAFA